MTGPCFETALKKARSVQRLDYEKNGVHTEPNIYFVNGEVLLKNRVLTRLDDKRILADAKIANRDLMERVNQLSF